MGWIMNRAKLDDCAKLHYLRSSLRGAPLTLIERFTLGPDSLKPAWSTLVARYENKRSLLNDQLDHLSNFSAVQMKNPVSLNTLVNEKSKIRKSLHLLVPKKDLGDCILAHRMSKLLDRPTREAWETSRINITELPTFEEFETFLIARIRAFEIAAATPPGSQKSSSSPTSKVAKVHHGSSTRSTHSKPPDSSKVTHSSRIAQHPCTYCGEPHFIVACPSFKRLTESLRRKFVMEKPLCYNCLGLHSAKNCKSQYRCKTSNGNHHTMILVPRDIEGKTQSSTVTGSTQQ